VQINNEELPGLTDEDIQHLVTAEDTPDEKRTRFIKNLVSVTNQLKELESKKISILMELSDPENNKIMYNLAVTVHGSALNHSSHNVDEILLDSFTDEEDYELYSKYRNKRFYKGKEVVEEFKDHPLQVKLRKEKYLTTRGFNKQKTIGQHLEYLCEAKRDFNIEDRLKKLEEQSKVHESRIKATEVLLDKEIISTENKFKSLRQQVESETKKLQMKILLDGDPALTDTRLAKLLGVSRQTIYRWKNDMSQEDWDEMKSNILEYFV